jgi:RTX calcium-binding nonapeptide repeat (4 copies)/Thrombospondin type 3 repeat
VRRVGTFAIALGACAALVPGSAAAHSLVRPAGAVVSYLSADATSLNTLRVGLSGNRIEFHDGTVDGGMDPGNCTPGALDSTGYIIQTFCPLGGVQRVRIDLGEREDSAVLAVPVASTVLGGPGADRVESGLAADEVSGGEGNDALQGGGGDDVLSGDQGADLLAGGAGSDRIAARDGETDDVTCGDGADRVEADTLDRVAADCESVTRVATAAPDGAADDGRPPEVEVGAPTLQRLGRGRLVRVYATSSERGALSASGSLTVSGLALPIKTIERERVPVAGGGAELTYRLRGRHWREARRGLRRGRRVVVRLGVVATDLAGQSSRRDAPPIRLAPAGRRGAGAAAEAARHPEPGDVDGDEVRDEVDNCPSVKNGSQLNTDGDAEGDACDGDDDADGVPDGSDNCRIHSNPGQEPHPDYPGYGIACPPKHSEPDHGKQSDEIIDDNDNCDFDYNPDQSDLDGDDRGDVCDGDDDGDDIDDGPDNCPTVYNIDYADLDGDGASDDWYQPDADRDGIGTACDASESTVGGPAESLDRRRPRLRVGAARRHELAALRAGLVVRLRCSEACGATVELKVSRGTARRLGLRRTLIIGGGSARLQDAGTTYAFVRFDRRAHGELFRMRRLRPVMTATAVDGSGNLRTVTRRLVLAR